MKTDQKPYIRLSRNMDELDPQGAAARWQECDLMTPDPITVDESAPVDDAVRLLEENEVSGLPVVDRDGLLVGRDQPVRYRPRRAVGHLCSWPGLASAT